MSLASLTPRSCLAADHALRVVLADRIDPLVSDAIAALVRQLEAASVPGIRNLHAGFGTLVIDFDPRLVSHDQVAASVETAWAAAARQAPPVPRVVEIPVRYGGLDGPDLEEVARLTGLTPAEVVVRHTAPLYRVAFLGFMPGFPYLTGLDPALAVPRLPRPRALVPQGSVAIGAGQAGIYACESPGGWRLLGRTTADLFDAGREEPSLLRIGDAVRFVDAGGTGR
jgi:KipI family sensor histidine kinase inhibitor